MNTDFFEKVIYMHVCIKALHRIKKRLVRVNSKHMNLKSHLSYINLRGINRFTALNRFLPRQTGFSRAKAKNQDFSITILTIIRL